MVDLGALKRNLERVESNGNFRLQTQAVQILITEVRKYVSQIADEEKISNNVRDLDTQARQKATTPDEEKAVADAISALETAKKIKRNIAAKKTALRQLEAEVKSLLDEIKKVL